MKKFIIAIIAAIVAIGTPILTGAVLKIDPNSPLGYVAIAIMLIAMAVFIYIAISSMIKTMTKGLEQGMIRKKR